MILFEIFPQSDGELTSLINSINPINTDLFFAQQQLDALSPTSGHADVISEIKFEAMEILEGWRDGHAFRYSVVTDFETFLQIRIASDHKKLYERNVAKAFKGRLFDLCVQHQAVCSYYIDDASYFLTYGDENEKGESLTSTLLQVRNAVIEGEELYVQFEGTHVLYVDDVLRAGGKIIPLGQLREILQPEEQS